VVLSNISLYALTHHKALGFLSSYYSVLFMVTCFYPFRYSVYGMFTIVKAYEAFCRISDEFRDVHKADLKSKIGISSRKMWATASSTTTTPSMKTRRGEDAGAGELVGLRNKPSEISRRCEVGEVLMVLTRVDS
jgi:hypothetical protein